jgi:diguanylate cyclase (GGDEF)-like protein
VLVSEGAAAVSLEQWRQLVSISHRLMQAGDAAAIHRIVSSTARQLLAADGASFIRLDGGECHYADEDAAAPLWKGLRVPMESCVSGSCMQHRVPIVVEDVQLDPRIAQERYRPTFIKSLAMVPVRKQDPLGAIAVYWASKQVPDEIQLSVLQALADLAGAAMDSVALLDALEQRVRERTHALEVAYKEFQQLALIDDLTGLRNRRGFFLLAQQQRRQVARSGDPAFIVFVDVDGLKEVNDTLGHEAGDQLLRHAARVLQATFRESDIVARLGGDEFCVLAVDGVCNPQMIRERFQRNVEAFNAGREGSPFPLSASVGIYPCAADDHTPLEQLVRYADQDMYLQKRTGRRVTLLAQHREAANRSDADRPKNDDKPGNE